MYLSELRIRNYRSIKDLTIKFKRGVNVLIGRNNVGKTNIVRAIDLLLGERWPTYVNVEHKDFYCRRAGEKEDDIIIIAKLEGRLPTDNRSSVEFTACEEQKNGDLFDPDYWRMKIDRLEKYAKRRYNLANLPLGKVSSVWIYFFCPRDLTGDQRRFVIVIETDVKHYWILSPNRQLRDSLITTAYIPAFRDPSSLLRISSYSWYGRLIKQLWEKAREQKAQEIQKHQAAFEECVKEAFGSVVKTVQERLGEVVFHERVSFKPGSFSLDDEYKQVTLFVDDGINTPFYDKGGGIQSALCIALFMSYCENFHKGGSLLLLEEPENYLHPHGQRALRASLEDFARGKDRQVIFCTHSSEFVKRTSVESIMLVRRDVNSGGTTICSLPDTVDDKQRVKFQQKVNCNPEMLFADRVLLVEGAEKELIEVLADIRYQKDAWLDRKNISVCRVNGKDDFSTYIELLKHFNIDWVVLADLDVLFDDKKAPKLLQAANVSQPDRILASIRNNLKPGANKELECSCCKKGCRHCADCKTLENKADKCKFIALTYKDGCFLIEHALTTLSKHGLFLLPYGQPECYMKPAARLLEESKERRMMLLAEKIRADYSQQCITWDQMRGGKCPYFHEDFYTLLEEVFDRLDGGSRAAEADEEELNGQAGD